MRRGVRLIDIGKRLGLAQPTVSRQLSGELDPHPNLIRAIRSVAGIGAAEEVATLLGVEVSP